MEKLKHNLINMLLIFIIGYLAFTVFSFYTINLVKINGEMYNEIVSGEKLIADILPTPGYIVQTNLYVQTSIRRGNVKKDEYLNFLNEQEGRYIKSFNKIKDTDSQKREMFESSNKLVMEYFDKARKIIEGKGNKEIELEELSEIFKKHESIIEDIVKYQREINIKKEISSSIIVRNIIILKIVVAIIILAFTIAMTIFLSKNILKYQSALKELIMEKNKFYSIIGHDLRGPVGTIKEMLKNYNEFEDEEEREEILENLQELSENTFNLLEELLEWTRLRSDDKSLEIKNIKVGIIINEILEMLEENINKKDIVVKREIYETELICNIDILKIILRNIISNAVKFTNKNGIILIKIEKKSGEFHITIKDNGIGMDQKTLEKIENNEHIVSERGTAGEKGSGIGLSFIKDLLKRVDGKMEINSERNKGTEIRIILKDQRN